MNDGLIITLNLYYIRIYTTVCHYDLFEFRNMDKIKKKIMWQYYIIFGTGLVLLLLAVLSFRNTVSFLKRAEKATGTVISLRAIQSEEGEVYSPGFSYRTKDSEICTYELPEGTNPPSWKIGETETIIYDPVHPSEARLYTYFRIFIWTLVLTSLSLPLLVIGGGYFIAERMLK